MTRRALRCALRHALPDELRHALRHAPRRALVAGVLAALSLLSPASDAQQYDAARAQRDWVLNCMGCHTVDARGIAHKVPPLRDALGHLVALPQGREYVMRVPGAANSSLSDAQLANVLNWLIDTMNARSRPAAFVPFSAAEVAAHRRPALTDVVRARARLVEALRASGTAALADDY